MTNTLIKKMFFMAAAISLSAVINPGALSAQTVSVGNDGYTRMLWKGADGSAVLWLIDPNLNYSSSQSYGPYDGYLPIAISVGSDNRTRLLWNATDGSLSVWLLDNNLNYVTSQVYKAVFGWSPETVTAGSDGSTILLWKSTEEIACAWLLDSNLNVAGYRIYGPNFGYDPANAKLKSSGSASPETKGTPPGMNRHTAIPVPPQISGSGSAPQTK